MITKSKLNWISKKIEEIDSRVEKFWNKPIWENAPVLQVYTGRMYADCRTSESSFKAQMESIEETLRTKTDWMPFLEPWHGTGVYAEAFGSTYFWKENDTPWTNFVIHSIEEAKKITKPDWKKSEIMNLVLESIRYFKKMVGENIPISLTDTQSPLDNAMLIWKTNSFIEACYDAPEVVHHLLSMITELIIEFSLVQIKEIGHNIARPGHNAALTRPWGKAAGIGISDDFLVTVSPKFYNEFGRQYNEKIAEALGGVVIHSCGFWSQGIISEVLGTKGIMGVELAISECGESSLHLSPLGDPNPNSPEAIRDGFKGTGVPVKGRLGDNFTGILERIYHHDLIFIPQIMWAEDGKVRDENYEKMHQKIEELINI
ncbi:MAG: uroporphyrinogen decarboxylase family protein [Candidatus Humimicrobiaceae bacterium]